MASEGANGRLLEALETGNLELVRQLLEAGDADASVARKTVTLNVTFSSRVVAKKASVFSEEVVEEREEKRTDVAQAETAMTLAVRSGKPDLVRCLLEAEKLKQDPGQTNDCSVHAVSACLEQIVGGIIPFFYLELLSRGANVALLNPSSPQQCGEMYVLKPSFEVLKLLLAHGGVVSDVEMSAARKLAQHDRSFVKLLEHHVRTVQRGHGATIVADMPPPPLPPYASDYPINFYSREPSLKCQLIVIYPLVSSSLPTNDSTYGAATTNPLTTLSADKTELPVLPRLPPSTFSPNLKDAPLPPTPNDVVSSVTAGAASSIPRQGDFVDDCASPSRSPFRSLSDTLVGGGDPSVQGRHGRTGSGGGWGHVTWGSLFKNTVESGGAGSPGESIGNPVGYGNGHAPLANHAQAKSSGHVSPGKLPKTPKDPDHEAHPTPVAPNGSQTMSSTLFLQLNLSSSVPTKLSAVPVHLSGESVYPTTPPPTVAAPLPHTPLRRPPPPPLPISGSSPALADDHDETWSALDSDSDAGEGEEPLSRLASPKQSGGLKDGRHLHIHAHPNVPILTAAGGHAPFPPPVPVPTSAHVTKHVAFALPDSPPKADMPPLNSTSNSATGTPLRNLSNGAGWGSGPGQNPPPPPPPSSSVPAPVPYFFIPAAAFPVMPSLAQQVQKPPQSLPAAPAVASQINLVTSEDDSEDEMDAAPLSQLASAAGISNPAPVSLANSVFQEPQTTVSETIDASTDLDPKTTRIFRRQRRRISYLERQLAARDALVLALRDALVASGVGVMSPDGSLGIPVPATLPPPQGELYVVAQYMPNEGDEISLAIGEVVVCQVGKNTSTGSTGIFPLVCVSNVPLSSNDIKPSPIITGRTVSLKRAGSMGGAGMEKAGGLDWLKR
ncbi:hypothetical protein HDU93_003985 [Gonapodya sp. JEL0774]|nr:hypothetical protein HDU93_003985 [Gonapodya sp. JEL0774]